MSKKIILAAVLFLLSLSVNTELYAAIGTNEISFIELQSFPEDGFVNEVSKADKTKRISGYTITSEYVDVIRTGKYEYDSSGNVIRVTEYNPDGSRYEMTDYEYDAGNRLTKLLLYNHVDFTPLSWVNYTYDSEGHLTSSTATNNNGDYCWGSEYVYDGSRMQSQYYKTILFGGKEFTIYDEYDKNGRLITHRNGDGSSKLIMDYNSKGQMTKITCYRGGDSSPAWFWTLDYDSDGRLFRRNIGNYGDLYSYVYSYENAPVKKSQSISMEKTEVSFNAESLEYQSQSFDIGAKAKGKVSCKKTAGSKYLTVSKDGKVKIARGTPAGTYRINIKLTASETEQYKKKTVTKKLTVVIR